MNKELILEIVSKFVYFLGGVVPPLAGFIIAWRKKVKATSEAEKNAAENAMNGFLDQVIPEVEELYADVNAVLKARGLTAGNVKKDTALTRLHAFAIEHGFSFNEEQWSKAIDEKVAMTHKVNS